MSRKRWLAAVIAGLAIGVIVASVMTFLDWRENPAGLFHDESGTDWRVVLETAVSWSAPVALVTIFPAFIVFSFVARRQRRQ